MRVLGKGRYRMGQRTENLKGDYGFPGNLSGVCGLWIYSVTVVHQLHKR